MSKWVSEIIKDIKNNPTDWKPNSKTGISNQKLNIQIKDVYNSAILSVSEIHVNGVNMWTKMCYIDRFRIEVGVNRWFKKAKLNQLYK